MFDYVIIIVISSIVTSSTETIKPHLNNDNTFLSFLISLRSSVTLFLSFICCYHLFPLMLIQNIIGLPK
jgi:hypothetical protein